MQTMASVKTAAPSPAEAGRKLMNMGAGVINKLRSAGKSPPALPAAPPRRVTVPDTVPPLRTSPRATVPDRRRVTLEETGHVPGRGYVTRPDGPVRTPSAPRVTQPDDPFAASLGQPITSPSAARTANSRLRDLPPVDPADPFARAALDPASTRVPGTNMSYAEWRSRGMVRTSGILPRALFGKEAAPGGRGILSVLDRKIFDAMVRGGRGKRSPMLSPDELMGRVPFGKGAPPARRSPLANLDDEFDIPSAGVRHSAAPVAAVPVRPSTPDFDPYEPF